MKITVLYNDDGTLAHGSETDRAAVESVIACARAVASVLEARGHEVALSPAARDPAALVRSLGGAELVWNLVESVDGDARLEAAVAWQLELAKLPYTGCPPLAMSLCLNKPIAKAVLAADGVPVARGALMREAEQSLPPLSYPCIVKPSREDASHGITKESIVHDEAALRARAAFVLATYAQPALVEEFLPGRELNVSVLGHGASARVLTPAEIDFSGLPKHHPPLVTYEAKWDEDSPICQGTPSIAAELSAPLRARVEAVALAAYRALGLRDYGRVDMRLDAHGAPVVLEVNPNPDISPDAGLAKAAKRSGIDYDELISAVTDMARARRA